MTRDVLICGEGLCGIISVRNDRVVGADEGLEWMIGKSWRHVYCWNRIKSFIRD